jgi:mRNA interferase RelE/StbE
MPVEHEVELGLKAVEAFSRLSRGDQKLILKQLEKLKRAPELGEALGNKLGFDLAGAYKLYAANKRLRVLYEYNKGSNGVFVLAIGPREAAKAYAVAADEISRRRLRRIS